MPGNMSNGAKETEEQHTESIKPANDTVMGSLKSDRDSNKKLKFLE